MPSDQLLKCFTITTLGLFDELLFVFRLVNSLCGPFQYSFHGHGSLDARENKTFGTGTDLVFVVQEYCDAISWMKDAEVFGFVPRNYSIHGSLVTGGDPVQSLALLDLVDDLFG